MARRRHGRPIHGWLVIDKPAGMTSAAVVGKVRALTGAAKLGHGGTLDPLATGVLPLAFGEATKTVAYVMDGLKVYRFAVRWGEERDTDDREGRVIATSSVRPGAEAIVAALAAFTGEIDQVPPRFSAVKVDGKRAYALARAAKTVELAPRRVLIERFELIRVVSADEAEFEVMAGKGAYMRALARDLARALGTVGHLSALRRTRVGPFAEKDAISLDMIAALGHSAALLERLRPVATALDDIPALAMTEDEARRLQSGQGVSALKVARRIPLRNFGLGTVFCAFAEGKPVALARFEGGELRPIRVLNL